MASPAVTVVLPVYNAMPWLTESLASLRAQTLPTNDLEVIAVDDRSTDDSVAELHRQARAWPMLRVICLEGNSGGPGKPRNVGIDHAKGEFVFFMDSDDVLGVEALERMLTMARENSADVVLGKMTPLPGFGTRSPKSMFRHNDPDADLFSSRVYWALNPLKLFRRSAIERAGARYTEGLATAEDQGFVSHMYLNASTISVVADYDCYFVRERPDGGNITKRRLDIETRLARLTEIDTITQNIAAYVPAGKARDHLVRRHVEVDVLDRFHKGWLALPKSERTQYCEAARSYLDDWLTDRIRQRLRPWRRLVAHLLQHGTVEHLEQAVTEHGENPDPDHLVDGDEVFLPLPFFRDPSVAIPDRVYRVGSRLRLTGDVEGVWTEGDRLLIRGWARLAPLPTHRQTVRVPVVARDRDLEIQADVDFDHDNGPSYRAELDLRRLVDTAPSTRWDFHVEVSSHGVTRRQRMTVTTLPDQSPTTVGSGAGTVVAPYRTDHGNLSVRLSPGRLTMSRVLWRRTQLSLTVNGCQPSPTPTIVLRRGSRAVSVPTRLHDGQLHGRLRWPMLRLTPGWWQVAVRAGSTIEFVRTPQDDPVRIPVMMRLARFKHRLVRRTPRD